MSYEKCRSLFYRTSSVFTFSKTEDESYAAVSCPSDGHVFHKYDDVDILEIWFQKNGIAPLEKIPEDLEPLLSLFISEHQSGNEKNFDGIAKAIRAVIEVNS